LGLSRILFYKYLFEKNLNKTREDILKNREKKFHKLINFVFKNSLFYKNYYQSHGIRERDLKNISIDKFPSIDKNIMMENYDQIITDKGLSKNRIETFIENNPKPLSILNNQYRVIHTSGSTGKIAYFIYNEREWDIIKAVSLRLFNNFGLKRKNYAFIGASDGHYAGISLFSSPLKTFQEYFYKNYLIINLNYPLSGYIDDLNKLNPDNLTGYPSALKMLANFQNKGLLNISPLTIVSGGEALSPKTKRYLKRTWKNSNIVNYYGASESIIIGIAKEQFSGLYIFDDINYIEIKDNFYYLTNLYNYSQPLIRYKMNDILRTVHNKDKKWPFTQVKQIIGRQENILWFRNQENKKEFIHPIVFVEFYVKGLIKFQIIQVNDIKFIFKAVIDNGKNVKKVKNKIAKKLTYILQNKRLSNVSFAIKVVNDIANDKKTNKYKLIINNKKE